MIQSYLIESLLIFFDLLIIIIFEDQVPTEQAGSFPFLLTDYLPTSTTIVDQPMPSALAITNGSARNEHFVYVFDDFTLLPLGSHMLLLDVSLVLLMLLYLL